MYGRAADRGRRRGETAACGRFCRALYDPLTRTGRSSAQPPRDQTMRIYGPNGATLGTPAGNVRRTSSSSFALPDPASTAENRPVAAPKASANIDALLAMQGIEED